MANGNADDRQLDYAGPATLHPPPPIGPDDHTQWAVLTKVVAAFVVVVGILAVAYLVYLSFKFGQLPRNS